MQSIQNYYVAQGAVITGDVVLAAGVNIWFATVIRGDLARITVVEELKKTGNGLGSSSVDVGYSWYAGI